MGVSIQSPHIAVLVNATNICGLEHPQPPTFKKIAGFHPGSNVDVLVHHTESRKCPRNSEKKDQCLQFPKSGTSANGNAGTTTLDNGNNAGTTAASNGNIGTTATWNRVTTQSTKTVVTYKQSPIKNGNNAADLPRHHSSNLSFLLLLITAYIFS